MKVREAAEEDIPEILTLLEQLFEMEEGFAFDQKRQEKALKMILSEGFGHIFVAEKSGELKATAVVHTYVSTAEGGISAIIEDVIVDAEERGKGLGQALLESIESWCRNQGITRMRLLVDDSNKGAGRFYQRHGWKKTNLRARLKYLP